MIIAIMRINTREQIIMRYHLIHSSLLAAYLDLFFFIYLQHMILLDFLVLAFAFCLCSLLCALKANQLGQPEESRIESSNSEVEEKDEEKQNKKDVQIVDKKMVLS